MWKTTETAVTISCDPTSSKYIPRPWTLNKPARRETRGIDKVSTAHITPTSAVLIISRNVGRLGHNKNALNCFSRATCFCGLLHNTCVLRSCAHALLCLLETLQIVCVSTYGIHKHQSRGLLLVMWPTDRGIYWTCCPFERTVKIKDSFTWQPVWRASNSRLYLWKICITCLVDEVLKLCKLYGLQYH
jgi:hypothetical protein